MDCRHLDTATQYYGQFDVVICFENIEHILNDEKLMVDMSRCLKPGGKFLLTTPNIDYRPMTKDDNGPFRPVEDGGHVRKGYSEQRLRELASLAGMRVTEIGFCSGLLSQKTTAALRKLGDFSYPLAWAATLPFRILPPLLDPLLSVATSYPGYSITMCAEKVREVGNPE